MVIFPILDKEQPAKEAVPIWHAIEASQNQSASSYWLVTQPAHAALAGELAAALRDELFGPIDATISRSIALHDYGWSMDDAEQIQRLRAESKLRPRGFLQSSAEESLQAWIRSIDAVEKFAAIGGYLVSRHFERLSHRTGKTAESKLETFRQREQQRQERLVKSLGHEKADLERLVDGLQFCDVLSLYLCCGSSRSVTVADPEMTVSRVGEGYRIEPSPFKELGQFNFPALRHPVPREKKAKAGATFYVNL